MKRIWLDKIKKGIGENPPASTPPPAPLPEPGRTPKPSAAPATKR